MFSFFDYFEIKFFLIEPRLELESVLILERIQNRDQQLFFNIGKLQTLFYYI